MANSFKPSKFSFSRKTKIWIGVIAAILIPIVLAFLAWFGYLACFPDNARLVVADIRLAGPSLRWNPQDPNLRYERTEQIIETLNLRLGQTHLFSVKPDVLAHRLMFKIPELKNAEVWRVLPDQLVFDLRERTPVADLGRGLYLDEESIVLDRKYCADLTGLLPMLGFIRQNNSDFHAGQDLSSDPDVKAAQEFMKTIRLETSDIIRLSSVAVIHNTQSDCIQCQMFFKDDPKPFTIIMPANLISEKVRVDILGRLIPVMEENLNSSHRSISLRFDGMAVIQ